MLFFLLFPFSLYASEGEPKLINHYLLECPAHLSGVAGAVEVEVVVGIDGKVVSSRIVSGALSLHEESAHIVQQLHFEPAHVDGSTVESTTVVTLQFGAHDHEPNHIDNEIVIYDTPPDKEDTQSRRTLRKEELEREAALDLADSIDKIPGVQQMHGAGVVSKPIIRGHQERRMLILFDGIRHESQKWGADHGTEIDPLSADSVSVVRGAAGARYGTDAIGGVILVHTPDMTTEEGAFGTLKGGYQSNGQRGFGAFRIDTKWESIPDWSFRIEGNTAKGASLSTPDYVLGNTGSEIWNTGIVSEYQGTSQQIRIGYRHYDFKGGLFYGMQNESPDAFDLALERESPPQADIWKTSYAIDRPYQKVTHDVVSLHLDQELGQWGEVEGIYAYQHNHREEFDRVRESIEGAQFDFTLRTHSFDLLFRHHPTDWKGMLLEGGFGVQGSFQEHVYTGLSLLPNFRSFSGGIFGFERFSVDRGDLEVSLRYDALSRDAFLYRLDWQRHKRRGTLTDDDCLYRDETEMARCSNRYQVGAFSMGGILHLLPEAVDLKLNISSASRFPNLDELYLNGTAPSFPVYGLGDPSLDIETTYGISSAVGIQTSWLEGEASLFTSFIDGFVYFAPEKSEDGSLHYDVTIQGAWPRYSYDGIPAVFLGADGYVSLFPKGVIGIQAELSTVQAFDWNSGAHLLGIPSDQGSLELIGRIPDRGAVQSLEIGMNIRHVTKQDRVDPESDFAEAPEAYTLFGARCDMKIERKGMNNPLRIGILASNLFNQSYREYNSLLRYFAHQPGRDVRFHIGLDW